MDFNKTVDLIIRDLVEAGEIIDDFRNYPGVPEIQVELARSKCRNAAEIIALLKNQKSENVSRKSADEKRKPETEGLKKKAGHAGKGIIADTFEYLPDSLNESLGSKLNGEDIPDYLRAKTLGSLSEVIGINDRFLFIRELFDGNADSFSKAISNLDDAKCLSDARTLMISLTGEKSQTEAGRQLLDLIKRKFPGDE